MQVIKTLDHKKYSCPLKYMTNTDYTGRCDGPKCMWWDYSRITDFSTFPQPPVSETDESKGYCGK